MKRIIPALIAAAATCTSTDSSAAVNESYIQLQILDRSELATLTRLVSIADVSGNDVWAFATDSMLGKLATYGYSWNVLPYPGRNEKIEMASSVDEVKKTWRNYPTYGQYVELLQSFAAAHSSICRLVEIGETPTPLGHKLFALKISDNPDDAEDEPEVFYSSTMHGNEPTGYILMLRFADMLLKGYEDKDPRLTHIVNNVELWINPLANPDGTYAGGDHTVKYATRSNSTGINLNRNIPDPVVGDHPDGAAWAPETLSFIGFAAQHNITLSANLHSGKEVVNYPWDGTYEHHPDDAWFMAIARAYVDQAQADGPNKYMTALNNGITNGADWFLVNGGRQDYMVYYHGAREVTIELTDKYLVNANELDRYWNVNRLALIGYIENALTGVRGVVTDQQDNPLDASVEVLELPSVGAEIMTDQEVGDYHRMLLPGTYRLRIASPNCTSVEQQVVVEPGAATQLDVKLACLAP